MVYMKFKWTDSSKFGEITFTISQTTGAFCEKKKKKLHRGSHHYVNMWEIITSENPATHLLTIILKHTMWLYVREIESISIFTS